MIQSLRDLAKGENMKKTLPIALILLIFALTSLGQKLAKPTLTSVKPTADQQKRINEGTSLHDAKKYDEAIAKYQSVLTESPDCTGAMYELAFSLYDKGDKEKALEVATKGAKYVSEELPLFYMMIANNLDDMGKPDEAVKIYKDGLKALEGDARFGRYRSSLFYNLGLTYTRLKNYKDAKEALKSAVENNFQYPSPHYLLAVVFNGTRYKVPAFLAAARFITLEYNTQRTATSIDIITHILPPAANDSKGNITITLDMNGPKDEGDFGLFDLILGTIATVRGDDDKGKSDNQMFIEGIGSVIEMLAEDKKLQKTFVGKTYVPFMVELKKKGYLEVFGNTVLFLHDKNPSAGKWIDANGDKMREFFDWAKSYSQPAQ